MKKTVFFFALILMLTAALLPTAALADEGFDATVYVDAANGADTNEGTAAAPVKSIAQAFALFDAQGLTAADSAEIVLVGTVNGTQYLKGADEAHAYAVTIDGKGTGTFGFTASVSLCGPTTFKSLTLHNTLTTNTEVNLFARGHKLVIESDVETTRGGTSARWLALFGGAAKGKTAASADMTVKAGTYRNVFAGSYNTVIDDAKLTMENVTVGNICSSTWSANGASNATITAKNCSFYKLYFSGYAATTTNSVYNSGDVVITLDDCTVSQLFRASDYKPATGGPSFTGNLTANFVNCGEDAITVDASTFQTYGAGKSMVFNVTDSVLPNFTLGEDTVLNLTASEGKTLTLTKTTTANSFTGGGTLAMPASAEFTVTGAVTGNTTLDFGMEAPFEKAYITAASGSTASFTYRDTELVREDDGTNTTWTVPTGREVGKIVLSVPEGVTLRLFAGINNESDSGEIDLGTPVTENGILTYTVADLPAGHYHYRTAPTTGTAYYKVVKNIVYDGEQLVIDANPGKRAESGFEPNVSMRGANFSTVHFYNDTTYETLLTGGAETAAQEWGIADYESYFATPGLKRSALLFTDDVPEFGRYQLTTNDEMYAFLRENVSAQANGYLFEDVYTFTDQYIEKDPLTYDMPVVIYSKTDLSGMSYEQAAAAVKNNGKPTVLYQGQVHSNEPTGGETGMVLVRQMALDSEMQAWLEDINLVIVPRANVIGAYYYSRYISGNGYINTYPSDMNREYIMASSDEVRSLLEIYNTFLPVTVIDGHECYGKTTAVESSLIDIYMSFGKTANAPTGEIVAHEKAAWDAAMAAEEAYGMRAGFYADSFYKDESDTSAGEESAPTKSINMAQNYYANRGSMSFLLEARGIYAGNIRLDRRVMSHMAAIEAIVGYVLDNLDEVAADCAAARSEMLDKTSYDENDRAVLKSGKNPDDFIRTDILIFDRTTGEYIKTNTGKYVYRNLVEDTIPLPLSYIIPKGLADVDYEGLERLAKYHDFKYTEEENLKLFVRQYGGAAGSATLGATAEVSFDGGAYVFPVNQSTGRLLALVFEPNYRDSYSAAGSYVDKTTLAGSGIVPAACLYRYEGATAAAEARRTIYVDAAKGMDTNEGSASAPVASIAQAFTLFDAQELTAADSVEIVLAGTVGASGTLGSGHEYAVTVKGGTLNLTGSVTLTGPVTFESMTLHAGVGKTLYANGYPFTVENDVVTTADGNFLTLYGGGASGVTCASTNLTLKGGTFRNIYVGNQNKPCADANIVLKDVTVQNLFSPSYNATGTTNANITATNTSFYKLYYSGAALTTASSHYNDGDVTITLENSTVSYLFRASDYKPANGNPTFTGNLTVNLNDYSTVKIDASEFKTYGADKKMVFNLVDCDVPAFNLNAATELNISVSKGETAAIAAAVTAKTLEGEGTLSFAEGASLTVTGAVTGTREVTLASAAIGASLITAPAETADTAFTYTPAGEERLTASIIDGEKVWMLTVPVVGEQITDVYVDTVNGADTNNGSENAPVATLEAAYAILGEQGFTVADSATIHLTGASEFVGTMPAHPYAVTITGGTLNVSAALHLGGPTTLTALTLHNPTTAAQAIYCNGHKTVITDDVTTTAAGTNYLDLWAGSLTGTVTSTDLTVNAGTYRRMYSGSRASVVADAKLSIDGVTVTHYFGPTWDAAGATNSTITVKNSDLAYLFFGSAAMQSPTTNSGNTTIYLENTSVASAFRPSSYNSTAGYESFSGNLTLTIKNNTKNIVVSTSEIKSTGGKVVINVENATLPAFVLGKNAEVNITAAAGQKVTLPKSVTAKTLIGGGIIAMPAEASITVTGSATGDTVLDLGGAAPFKKTYVSAPGGSTASFSIGETALVKADDGSRTTWSSTTGTEVGALTLTVPKEVTLRLFAGVNNASDAGEINLGTPVESNGILIYTLEGLDAGTYHYRAKSTTGKDYYTVVRNFNYDGSKRTIDANPGKRAGTGFEPNPSYPGTYTSTVFYYTDEVYDKLLRGGETVAAAEWGITDYDAYFATPGLKRSKLIFTDEAPEVGRYQVTTNAEMYQFLRDSVTMGSNMYLFEDAYTFDDVHTPSDLSYNMPVVIFSTTDLTGMSYEQAAKAVNNNGKPTLFYHGQMHSSEPAGGEAAMTMVRRIAVESEKQAWLEDINIVAVPRINVMGAHYFTRYISNNGYINTYPSDINREYILASNDEVRALLEIYNTFLPIACIDEHEAYASTSAETGRLEDVSIAYGKTANANNAALVAHEEAAYALAMAAEEERGIRAKFYGDEFFVNEDGTSSAKELAPTKAINMALVYYANRGSLSFLNESRGIYAGNIRLDRRVMTHITASEAIIDYIAENAETIADDVAAARSEMLDKTSFDANDTVVLKSGRNANDYVESDGSSYSRITGELIKEKTEQYIFRSLVEDEIALPTAYIIPKGRADVDYETLERIAQYHMFTYHEVEPMSLSVKAYGGAHGSAVLGEAAEVSFDTGAYVFPMNQSSALLLAQIFEPNCLDNYDASKSYADKCNLAAANIVPVGALYRYEGELPKQESDSVTIDTVGVSDTGVMLDLSVTGECSGKLIVAIYGSGEQFLGAKIGSFTAGTETASFDFGSDLARAVTVKAFAVDAADGTPLCAAADFPIAQ